ncbi:hypothetical protein EW026_g821 [Hermanssonia centrifuga]|uniref:Glyoxal oxidase n=1 Tax=Hermanssonia centrifuga TaxID=98765 RepID=A0A4S4KTF9_9APHY|nr:hypothetical protein EW026_g821 [Hermanssonia centrifuga]
MLAPLLAIGLGASSAFAAGAAGAEGHKGGSFEDGGDTLVSGLMLMLGNDEKVYILDKSEGNAAQVNGHAAWGSVYDIATRTATTLEVITNPFCSSGMHMPNGSYITFGGNSAVGPGANPGDVGNGLFDTTYQDYAGQQAVRILNPLTCTGDDAATSDDCQWFDNSTVARLQAMRWYSTAEPMGDGTVAVIGGFSNGGYINRNYPENPDPVWQGGASQPTYEFWPSRGQPVLMQFLVDAGGLNSYPHTFLMASVLWDPVSGDEIPLPPMPDNIVRVYPASGAVAMLPLTPANNYSQTVLFCGGSDMPDDAWGNYSWPFINTWDYPASAKCHQLEPEPQDGSAPAYVDDDPMPEGRTMGQFILLPNGQMLVVNGGLNGTAGYSTQTLLTTSYSDMPFGMSLAAGPVGTPAIYTPGAPAGQRWSNAGFDTSDIPRLYHSSALLLPDASVLIAGSNPNVDVNTSTFFPTTYKAEIWYPPYFSAPTRPVPSGVPKTISYGGDSFDITIPASSYSGSANDAADNTTVMLMRPGFTTHAMNMGQRALQLNNTYTVNQDGSYILHVAQAPPNANLFQPGPALFFVNVNGIPSNGTMLIVGNGQCEGNWLWFIEQQQQ